MTNATNKIDRPVNIISKEQKVRLGWVAHFVEVPQQVGILAVNVPTDYYWGGQLQQHGLGEEELT